MTNAQRVVLAMLTATLLPLGLPEPGTAAETSPRDPGPPSETPAGSDCSAAITPALYARLASLQETLLATRGKYAAWLVEQPLARKAVEFSPWLATPPLPAADAAKLAGPAGGDRPERQTA